MKRVLVALILSFLIFGIVLHAPLVIADKNDSNSGNSNNSGTSAGVDDSEKTDEESNKTRERTEIRARERDNESEREFKSEIRAADGSKVKFERKIRVKNGEVEIRTKLKVEGNGANFSIVDSDGERHRIRVTPEKLRALILEKLNASNITDFSLEEVEHKNIPRVVFKVNSEHPGRFLGVFKLSLKAQTQVDPETGEVLDVNVPWWAFLVSGEDISDEIVGDEAIEDEIVASDNELEDEFGDVEVDEELEIKAETRNGTSEVKVEFEFSTEATEQEQIVNEILDRLSGLNVSDVLEVEESDEALEAEEKLEAEAEIEEGIAEVEFELRFIVNSDNRETIISAVTERLSLLTADKINSIFSLEVEEEDEDDEEDEDELEEEENETETNSSA